MNYERLLAPLRRRMATLIGRCILSAVRSGEGFQTLDVVIMADENMGGVEHAEPYGFTSNPHPGAEGVVLNIAGQRASCVALNLGNRRYRLRGLKTGEVALYTDEGDKLVFGRGRKVHLTTETFLVDAKTFESVTETIRLTASAGTSIKTPSFSLGGTGDGACASTFTGSLKTTGDVVAGTVSLQSHVHTGVQSGNGTTGQPQG